MTFEMDRNTLSLLDSLLFIFHNLVIFVNLFGWMIPFLRKTQRILISLTAFSWFVLGFFYGFGYCIVTDIHYQILYLLGSKDLPNSYIKYLLDKVFGTDLNALTVDIGTGIGFAVAVIGAFWAWRRERRQATAEGDVP